MQPDYAEEQPKRPLTFSDDDVMLTGPQTREWVGGKSTMCIWRWLRDPRVNFPQPLKINGRNYWRLGGPAPLAGQPRVEGRRLKVETARAGA